MQEYWINIYTGNVNSSFWRYKKDARNATNRTFKLENIKTLYRIHVKMKPAYVQLYGRGNRTLKPLDIHESWKWL